MFRSRARNRRLRPRPAGSLRSTLRHFPILIALLVAALCGCNQAADPMPNYREDAYVTNGGSSTVTVVDLRSLSIRATVPVGRNPTGVTANPRKNEIYVANADSNNISVIDAESNKVVFTIGVHRGPYFVAAP